MSDTETPIVESNRPDPANIIAVNIWIMDRLEALERARGGRRVNASDAARELGYEQKYFHGHPWRIPYFGLQGRLHTVSTWREWNKRPEAERRAEWDAMSLADRRLARGIQ